MTIISTDIRLALGELFEYCEGEQMNCFPQSQLEAHYLYCILSFRREFASVNYNNKYKKKYLKIRIELKLILIGTFTTQINCKVFFDVLKK